MELYETYRNKEFRLQVHDFLSHRNASNFAEYVEKYGPENNLDAAASDNSLVAFYEGVGFFVKQGWISIQYVEDIMAESIVLVWEKYQPILIGQREVYGPRLFDNFEFLYDEIKRMEQQNLIH
jgi:hypothetical protein